MHVIKWPRTDSDGSCVNKNVCGNKGFYSSLVLLVEEISPQSGGLFGLIQS